MYALPLPIISMILAYTGDAEYLNPEWDAIINDSESLYWPTLFQEMKRGLKGRFRIETSPDICTTVVKTYNFFLKIVLEMPGGNEAFQKPDLSAAGWNLLASWIEKLELTKLEAKLPADKMLSLRNQNLMLLPKEIGKCTSLTSLNLERNQLIALPEECSQLKKLVWLNCSSNDFTELPSCLLNLDLHLLALCRNHIQQLPEAIGNFQNLYCLTLTQNSLSTLPSSLGQLTNLQTLYLDGNHFTEIPAALCQLPHLSKLSLVGNGITSLPDAFFNLKNLAELYLTNNQLTQIPEQVALLTKLEYLDLGGNKLTSLPKSIGKMQSLIKLWINDNQISELPKELMDLDGKIHNIVYHGNNLDIKSLLLIKSMFLLKFI